MEENLQFPVQEAMSEAAAKTDLNETELKTGSEDTAAIPSVRDEQNDPDNSLNTSDELQEAEGDIEETESNHESVINVKFNKQERTYTVEQAAPLVEMGLKWDSFRSNHEKLRYIAISQGKSVGELIDYLIEDNDKRIYQQLVEECGGNEQAANRLFESQKALQETRFEKMCSQEEKQEQQEQANMQMQIEQRLADDYFTLCEEIPEKFKSFSDIPPSVIESAVKDDITLFDAYLRYQHYESKRTAEAQMKQYDASVKSAGSLDGVYRSPENDVNSFKRAFYTALR